MKSAARLKFYFQHIGKTAGTTLRNHLVRHVGASNVAPMIRRMSLRDALAEYARFDVITGHISAAPGDKLPRDRTCITLLRDPVDRVLSEFFFSRTIHFSGIRGPGAALDDFEAWLEAMSPSEIRALNAHLDALWPFGWDEHNLLPFEKRLAAAKQGLDRFDLIGVQHRLHEFVAMLDFYAGWHAPDALPRDNPTPTRIAATDLRPETLARLRQMLAPDIELFEYAQERFAKQRLNMLLEATRPQTSIVEPDVRAAVQATEVIDGWSDKSETDIGSGEMIIEAATVTGQVSGSSLVQTGEWVTICISLRSAIDEPNLCVGIAIRDHSGGLVFGTNTLQMGDRLGVIPGRYAVTFRFANTLGLGRYRVSAALHRGGSHLEGCFHWAECACEFEVIDLLTAPFEGRVRLVLEVHAESLDDSSRLTVIDDAACQTNVAILGRRNPPLRSFEAELRPIDRLIAVPRGADGFVTLIVVNHAAENWPAYGRQAVHVSYHWIACDGTPLVFDGVRTSLPHDVSPGQSIQLRCFFRAPDVPGRASLVWTLVQEEVAWFDDREPGSRLVQHVDVRAQESVAAEASEPRLRGDECAASRSVNNPP